MTGVNQKIRQPKQMGAKQMGRVLIVAGSDPSGGAGIQADIKTVTMMGQYAATAITAVTVQNTCGVTDVHGLTDEMIAAQVKAVLDDVGADVIKTGMLHSAATIRALVRAMAACSCTGPLVVDPVMVATSGDALIARDAIEVMRTDLIARAAVVTPNIPEAELLTDIKITSVDDMVRAGRVLLSQGCKAVVVKGGHMAGNRLTDILLTGDTIHKIETGKIDTRHTHGTGCTFASALAALIAAGKSVQEAFEGAHAFVREAIINAPAFGAGHGPLGHASVREALPW